MIMILLITSETVKQTCHCFLTGLLEVNVAACRFTADRLMWTCSNQVRSVVCGQENTL